MKLLSFGIHNEYKWNIMFDKACRNQKSIFHQQYGYPLIIN